MAAPFQEQPLPKVGLWDKMKPLPKEHALIELNNMLAAAPRIINVSMDSVIALTTKYKCDFVSQFRDEIRGIMVQLIRYCLVDSEFQEHELEDISHLKNLLNMNDELFNDAQEQVVREVYSRNMKEVMADNVVTDEEKAHLSMLRERFKIADDVGNQLYRRQANVNMMVKLDEVTRDNRLTPDEEQELLALGNSLGVEVKLGAKTAAALQQMRELWVIENKPLVEITPPVPVTIDPDERCYYQLNSTYVEMHDMSRATGLQRAAVRMKITKAIYFPSDEPLKYSWTDEMVVASGEGTLTLTNKKLLFRSPKLQVDCPIEDIIDFHLYKNGIVLDLEFRPTMFFGFTENQYVFCGIIARLLRRW